MAREGARARLGEKPRELTARIPAETYGLLEAEADAKGLSVNAMINLLVAEHVNNAADAGTAR